MSLKPLGDSDEEEAKNKSSSSPISGQLSDVSAIGVFVDRHMILKVFPELDFESSFKGAHKDFKSECLTFLTEVDQKDDLIVRKYAIGNDTYSMYCCTVGDKEIVFLMDGKQQHPHPTVDTLHVAVNDIIASLKGDGSKGGNRGLSGFSSLEEVFRAMDLNGDGYIDNDEFDKGISALGLEWKEKHVNKLFSQIDTSGKGNISFTAFMKFMMKPSNKKPWKELKRAINNSISMPNVKTIKNSSLDSDQYQKKLSQMEKLINMMEESMIESELADNEQQFWRNKICGHREFVRRHQDVVGRALSGDNIKLKKSIVLLEEQIEKTGDEVSAPPKRGKDASRRGSRRGSKRNSSVGGTDEDQQKLIARLRRENQEIKREMKEKAKQLKKLELQGKRRGSGGPSMGSRRGSRRGSALDMDESQLEDMISRLKKENHEMRVERNETRKERDELKIQLKAAQDKYKNAVAAGGGDEELLAQLARARRNEREQRKQKNKLRDEAIRLKGVSAALQKKLDQLAQKLENAGRKDMAKAIRSQDNAPAMIDTLADQLFIILDKNEKLALKIKQLEKEIMNLKRKHENEINKLKEKIKMLESQLNDKENEKEILRDENNILKKKIDKLNEQRKEDEKLYAENKKLKEKLDALKDELSNASRDEEMVKKELAQQQMRNKNLVRQMKLMEKMPGSGSYLKRVDRLMKIFRKLDKDEDGKLNFDEFEAGAKELGFGDTLEEQKQAFEQLDKNEDGFVEWEDFRDACLRNMDQQNKAKNDKEWKQVQMLLSKPPGKWSNEDVALWLSSTGLQQYQDNFENVDGNMLINMKNKKDLKNLGVEKSAHVRKMIREIKDLKNRNDLLDNLQWENDKLKDELNNLKKNGPTWEAVHLLQRRVRDQEEQLRKEKYARENIMLSVKQELADDQRFDNLNGDYEDAIAEVALLKGALKDANNKLKNHDKRKPDQGSAYENDMNPGDALEPLNANQPIGRFLQKWYVLANHKTQYWVSRTNSELSKRDEHYKKLKDSKKNDNNNNNNNNDNDNNKKSKKKKKKKNNDNDNKYDSDDDDDDNDITDELKDLNDEYTEALDWILFDTRRKRLISEVRLCGRGAPNDPKDVKVQMSVSPSGPWTNVKDYQLKQSSKRQKIGGFEAESRFWRIVFMSNYGENSPDAPRYVLYEVQFWGPLDEDVENNHFVIE